MRKLVVVGMLAGALIGCGAPAVTIAPQPAAPQSLAEKREEFARGYRLARQGQLAQARPIFERLVGRCDPLDDYCLHFLALSLARTGEPQRALELWDRLQKIHPNSVLAPEA